VRNERGIIINWLVKLMIGLAIGGVIIFDTGSILVNYFGLDSAADEIANQIATDITAGKYSDSEVQTLNSCDRRPTTNAICTAIQEKVKEKDAKLLNVVVDLKGNIKLRLKRTADTLVVERIGPIESWATAIGEGEAATETQ
jgi:hypothetical protein